MLVTGADVGDGEWWVSVQVLECVMVMASGGSPVGKGEWSGCWCQLAAVAVTGDVVMVVELGVVLWWC